MPISALEAPTVAALSSSQGLLDSVAVVKELIENAYDAQATSISIELSLNTLDIIQIRDNGKGIPTEDRKLVGQRHCTSKLAKFEDLAQIGGKSFGFRGDALASIVDMASNVCVTTRCEGDAVGVTWTLYPNGQLMVMKPTAHPIGTTIRVSDFLKALPVRRQTVLRDSSKYISKIKTMLQSYALALSSVRLSLAFLKAKAGPEPWLFVPSANDSIAECVMKVLGKDIAAGCSLHEICSSPGDGPEGQYEMKAFLPRSDTDWKKISSKGLFISVDRRPTSSIRGTLKDIGKAFRTRLQQAASTTQNDKVVDPFMWLHLRCPPGSYDLNVEPSKTDLLFTDPSVVLSLFERLMINVYGSMTIPGAASQTWTILAGNGSSIQLDQDTLQTPRKQLSNDFDLTPITARQTDHIDEDDLLTICGESLETQQGLESGIVNGLSDRMLNNPWTKAKLNASSKSRNVQPGWVTPPNTRRPIPNDRTQSHGETDDEIEGFSTSRGEQLSSSPSHELFSSPSTRLAQARSLQTGPGISMRAAQPFKLPRRAKTGQETTSNAQIRGKATQIQQPQFQGKLFTPSNQSHVRFPVFKKPFQPCLQDQGDEYPAVAKPPSSTKQPSPFLGSRPSRLKLNYHYHSPTTGMRMPYMKRSVKPRPALRSKSSPSSITSSEVRESMTIDLTRPSSLPGPESLATNVAKIKPRKDELLTSRLDYMTVDAARGTLRAEKSVSITSIAAACKSALTEDDARDALDSARSSEEVRAIINTLVGLLQQKGEFLNAEAISQITRDVKSHLA